MVKASIDPVVFQRWWDDQDGKCAITRLPMDVNGVGLNEVVAVPCESRSGLSLQLALKWAADARGEYKDWDVRGVLARYKAYRDVVFDHMASLKSLMDHFGSILRRGGLSVRNNSVSGMSVYHIREPNEFDGRFVAEVEYRGFLDFGSDINYGKDRLDGDMVLTVNLEDPNYHLALLRFSGVEEYKFQIFADHDVFGDL